MRSVTDSVGGEEGGSRSRSRSRSRSSREAVAADGDVGNAQAEPETTQDPVPRRLGASCLPFRSLPRAVTVTDINIPRPPVIQNGDHAIGDAI